MESKLISNLRLQCPSPETVDDTATRLLDFGADIPVWLWEGPMGAGKTTLIKSVCHLLGVQETTSSPTFSIVNEYTLSKGGSVYHIDCYRLRNEKEALDIGIEEYFYSGHFCMVEWPSLIPALWPDRYLKIDLSLEQTMRLLDVSIYEK